MISYIGNGGVTRRFEDSVAHREHPALAILDFQQSRLFEWEHETWRVYFDAYFVVFEVGFERFRYVIHLFGKSGKLLLRGNLGMIAHILYLEEFGEAFDRMRLENYLDRPYLQIEHQIGRVYLILWEVGLLVRHVSESETQAESLLDSIAFKLLHERNARVVLQHIHSEGFVLQLDLN